MVMPYLSPVFSIDVSLCFPQCNATNAIRSISSSSRLYDLPSGEGALIGEWRRTAEHGAEHFMAKWVAAEKAKAGLRHAVVCLNVTGRTKERTAQSKRARAGSLALAD